MVGGVKRRRGGGKAIIYDSDSSTDFEDCNIEVPKMLRYKCESCDKKFERWEEFCRHIRVCRKVDDDIQKWRLPVAKATIIKEGEDTRTKKYILEVQTEEASTRRMEEESARAAALMEELDRVRQTLVNDRAWNNEGRPSRIQIADAALGHNELVDAEEDDYIPDDFADDEADRIMLENALGERGIDVSTWLDTNENEANIVLNDWRQNPELVINTFEQLREAGEL